MNVLFIDDDFDICRQAELFLEQEGKGLKIETITSPKKGLKMLRADNYDAVVSDYKMEEMDGIDLLKTLREEENDDIPFIFFTGKGREEVAMEALNLGANRYVRKGGDPSSQYSYLARAITEEVKSHRQKLELQEKRERLDSVFDASSELIFIKNREGEYVDVNERFLEVFDASKEEIIGKTDFEIFPEDEAEEIREDDNDIIETGTPSRKLFELTIDGEKLSFDTRKVPLTEKDEAIEGVCGFAKNITELRAVEDEAKEVAEFREKIIDGANIWLSVFDEDGKVLIWNKEAEEVSGYSREEVTNGEEFLNYLFPDENNQEKVLNKFLSVSRGEEKVENFEGSIQTKGGDWKVISWSFRNLAESEEEGKVVVVGCDITESKKKEGVKRKEKEFLELFNGFNNPVFLHDLDGDFLRINDSACDLFGYSREEFLQMNFYELVSEEFSSSLEERIEDVKKGRELVFEGVLVSKNSEKIPVEISSQLIKYEEKDVVLTVSKDITEKRKAEFQNLKESLIPMIVRDVVEDINEEFDVNFMYGDLDLNSLNRNLADLDKSSDLSQILDLIINNIKRELRRENVKAGKKEIRKAIIDDILMFIEEIIDLAENKYIKVPSQYKKFLNELKK